MMRIFGFGGTAVAACNLPATLTTTSTARARRRKESVITIAGLNGAPRGRNLQPASARFRHRVIQHELMLRVIRHVDHAVDERAPGGVEGNHTHAVFLRQKPI